MKNNPNDQPPVWRETVNLPGRPPIRNTVDMKVMKLARELVGLNEKIAPDERAMIVDMYYDSIMKSELMFKKANDESYRGKV